MICFEKKRDIKRWNNFNDFEHALLVEVKKFKVKDVERFYGG